MKNTENKKISNGIALAVLFFVTFSTCSNIVLAQGSVTVTNNTNPCFSVSAVWVTDGTYCTIGQCGPTPYTLQHCVACVDVTITCTCSTHNILHMSISSLAPNNDDCHNVCSPSGDFSILAGGCSSSDYCSYCDPRDIIYSGNGSTGLTNGNSATFRICHRYDSPTYVSQSYNISLPSGSCGMPPSSCTSAVTVTF